MGLPFWNLMSVVEAIETAQHAQPMIDGGGRGLGVMIELAADIVEQARLVNLGERAACLVQPASQVQQVITVSAQGAQRKLTKPLGIEEVVSPGEFPALLIEQPIGRSASRHRIPQNEAQGHSGSASSRQRVKSLLVAPAAKKLLGSWPAGKWTMRTFRPR